MVAREHIDEDIKVLVDCIREYRTEQEQLDARIEDLKAELRQLLEERGENWSDDAGYARLISEGERIYYDRDALDKLLIQDPLRYGWLKDFRLTSPVQGRVQVK